MTIVENPYPTNDRSKSATPTADVQDEKTVQESTQHPTDPPTHVVADRLYRAYGLPLLPTVIVILSFIFYGFLGVKKSIQAPQRLVDFRAYSIRSYAQAFALLATLLATGVKWGLQRAFRLTAQKRFLSERSVYEVEIWSALGSSSIFWTGLDQNMKRWATTFITAFNFVLVIGLTSGFVALLTPFPMEVGQTIVGETELNFAMNTANCVAWYEEQFGTWYNESCGWDTDGTGRCATTTKLLEVMEGGRVSMLGHIANTKIDGDIKDYVSSLPSLASLRILGSTGGIAPVSYTPYTASGRYIYYAKYIGKETFYDIYRQGVWGEVSCQYVDPSALPFSIHNVTDGLEVRVVCGDPSSSYNRTADAIKGDLLFMEQCFDRTTRVWDIYARSFFTLGAIWNPMSKTNAAYGGVGSMKCTLTPTVRTVHVEFNTSIDAFIVPPANILPPTEFQPVDLLEQLGWTTWTVLDDAQTSRIGNLVITLMNTLGKNELDLPEGIKDDRYLGLMASMLKGMYEYQASHYRYSRTTNTTASPPMECVRPVEGEIFPHTLGWEPKTTTVIGLIPLAIIAILLLYFTFSTMLKHEKLLRFDPTNTISLIAATSAGQVNFGEKVDGDPQSELVRTAKVKYGPVEPPTAGEAKWGLVMVKEGVSGSKA